MRTTKELLIKLFYIIIVINLSACFSEDVVKVTTIHLQEANVTGPINQSPIHLSEEAETPFFTVSPKFSYVQSEQINSYVSGHTPINSEGIFEVDTLFYENGAISYYQVPGANIYEYEGQNLSWNQSSVTAGFDFDARFTKAFAAFLGINYTSTNNQNLWGGNTGLSLLLTTNELGLRLDAGLFFQSIAYDAYTVEIVQTSNSEYVIFYHDIGESTHWDPFASLTINTSSPDWFVNFFLNLGFSQQTLVGFTPEDKDETYYHSDDLFFYEGETEIVQDLRGESTASYINVTPGLFFKVGRSSRILFGVRFYYDNGLDDSSKSNFILPILQADFMF
jgi:hypothetical protein